MVKDVTPQLGVDVLRGPDKITATVSSICARSAQRLTGIASAAYPSVGGVFFAGGPGPSTVGVVVRRNRGYGRVMTMLPPHPRTRWRAPSTQPALVIAQRAVTRRSSHAVQSWIQAVATL